MGPENSSCQQVFKDPKNPLDKEFGCFAAIVGPPGTQLESSALLQVDVGAAKGKAAAKNTPAVLVSIPLADLQRWSLVDLERLISAVAIHLGLLSRRLEDL